MNKSINQKYYKNTATLKLLDETKLRNTLSKARTINIEYAKLTKTINCLADTSANIFDYEGMQTELIKTEMYWRLIANELLDRFREILTPREFSIFHLHYIEYNSWSEISEILNIDRRYALQVHKTAILKVVDKTKDPILVN